VRTAFPEDSKGRDLHAGERRRIAGFAATLNSSLCFAGAVGRVEENRYPGPTQIELAEAMYAFCAGTTSLGKWPVMRTVGSWPITGPECLVTELRMKLENVKAATIRGFRVGYAPDGAYIALQFVTDAEKTVSLALPRGISVTFLAELREAIKAAARLQWPNLPATRRRRGSPRGSQ
jgi:hypothetical protein